jgi:hypothetical protein
MSEDDGIEFDEIQAALEVIAEWLIACCGDRILGLRVELEGYYTGRPEYYGILPWIDRAEDENKTSLPSSEVRYLAEAVFTNLVPAVQITRQGSRRNDAHPAAGAARERRNEQGRQRGAPAGDRHAAAGHRDRQRAFERARRAATTLCQSLDRDEITPATIERYPGARRADHQGPLEQIIRALGRGLALRKSVNQHHGIEDDWHCQLISREIDMLEAWRRSARSASP